MNHLLSSVKGDHKIQARQRQILFFNVTQAVSLRRKTASFFNVTQAVSLRRKLPIFSM